MSFPEFIEGYLADPPKPFARRWRIAKFVANHSGKPAVTHMFRYDSMGKLIAFINRRFETDIGLIETNVSPKIDLALPRALRARLEIERAEDFAIYADHAQ